MHVGFIVTAPYQLFHYRQIQKHLSRTTAFIEVRRDDFGVTAELVKAHLPGAAIKWVSSANLSRIDGVCDVLVCQTPVPLMHFFSRSLTVAQQYSLAKEEYQYGVWRAQADLNLMYGEYSKERVSAYSSAVACGNPLLDDVLSAGLPSAPEVRGRPRVLYMPTYGDISDKTAALRRLMQQEVDLSVKAHHADREIIELARKHHVSVFLSDSDPAALIRDHDAVVSDYSGAIYDALALRKPVLLIDALNTSSKDFHRLSSHDLARDDVTRLAAVWSEGTAFGEALAASVRHLGDESTYRQFVERYFSNPGGAGESCADQIRQLVEKGGAPSFAVRQVRETNRRYILENRELKDQNARLSIKARHSLRIGRHDLAFRPLVLKTLRWLIVQAPGGVRFIQMLRRLRGRMEAAASTSVVGGSLPVVPAERRQAVLDVLVRVLSRFGIDHRTHVSSSRAYCAVQEDNLPEIHKALRSLKREFPGEEVTLWLSTGGGYRKLESLADLQFADLVECESVAIGVIYRNESLTVERAGAAELLIIETRDVRKVAKRWRADKVDWTAEFEGRALGAPAIIAPPHRLENEPVDVVYTWVDSSDPDWQAKRNKWAEREHVELVASDNEERFIDREELRYSLRSLHLYAPFVRRIFIVTAGHQPAWLNREDSRIEVISHDRIFPSSADLPTFNSHAIEASLHRIPGLAEHFLYFNDDVFLGRETSVETFYTRAGLIKSRFSPTNFTAEVEPDATAIPTDWASYNAIRIMARDFGMHFDRKMKHVPMAMKRSVLEEIEQRYSEEMQRTRSARFRARSDISFPSMFAHYYAIATGRGVEWENVPSEYSYADTGRSDFPRRVENIRRKKPTFFCLNVTRHSDIALNAQAGMLQAFMRERFPVASPYEIVVEEKE